MIEQFALRIATKIHEEEDSVSIDVLRYALIIVLNTTMVIAITIIASSVTGHLLSSVLSMLTFGLLRLVSGGYHLKSATACVLLSSILFIAVPIVASHLSDVVIYMGMVSLVLVAVYAPSRIEDQSNIPKRYYPVLKIISILIVASTMLIGHDVMIITAFIQTLLLMTFVRGGAK